MLRSCLEVFRKKLRPGKGDAALFDPIINILYQPTGGGPEDIFIYPIEGANVFFESPGTKKQLVSYCRAIMADMRIKGHIPFAVVIISDGFVSRYNTPATDHNIEEFVRSKPLPSEDPKRQDAILYLVYTAEKEASWEFPYKFDKDQIQITEGEIQGEPNAGGILSGFFK